MDVAAIPFGALGLPADAPLAAELRARLAAVELVLAAATRDAGPLVDRRAHPYAVDGIRVHAAFALLGGHGGRPATAAVTAAAVVELTHLATRYHDAVAAVPVPVGPAGRRQTAQAVLAGDLLIVRATGLAGWLPWAALRGWADLLGAVHEAKLAGRFDAAAVAMRAAAYDIGAAAVGRAGRPPAAPVAAARHALERHLTTSAPPAARAAR